MLSGSTATVARAHRPSARCAATALLARWVRARRANCSARLFCCLMVDCNRRVDAQTGDNKVFFCNNNGGEHCVSANSVLGQCNAGFRVGRCNSSIPCSGTACLRVQSEKACARALSLTPPDGRADWPFYQRMRNASRSSTADSGQTSAAVGIGAAVAGKLRRDLCNRMQSRPIPRTQCASSCSSWYSSCANDVASKISWLLRWLWYGDCSH
jgi:hypothetical protein